MQNKFTGERLETSVFSRNTVEHLHRYAITENYTKDKVVLDIASGNGYGSNLISKNANFVYGVDIDKLSIDIAKQTYKKENIKFLEGSTSNIPLEDNTVDVVVSFETIEHHDEHDQMIIEIKRVLKPNGLLILSSPDKLYYSDLVNFKNEFHVKELYKKELIDLVNKYFKNTQLLNQTYANGNSIIQIDKDIYDTKTYFGDFSNIEERIDNPIYLIAISSDIDFQKQEISMFDGSKIIGNNVLKLQEKFRESNSYKLGHFILSPLKFIKRLF